MGGASGAAELEKIMAAIWMLFMLVVLAVWAFWMNRPEELRRPDSEQRAKFSLLIVIGIFVGSLFVCAGIGLYGTLG